MELFPELKKRYSSDAYNAREAQRMAEFIAWGPAVFQVTRLMVKYGILDLLRDNPDGLTLKEILPKAGISEYGLKCLMEASLCIGTVLVDTETDKFTLSKVGWFLLADGAAKVNLDFNHFVNYRGFYDLDKAIEEGRPAGLPTLGDWPTIYEGLSSLGKEESDSWFAFDHFYSDGSFERALEIVFGGRSVRNLLDVGGNTGKWALQCVEHDKDVNVTILDLPQQIGLMKDNIKGKPGEERIHGYPINMLDKDAEFPQEPLFDAIWMSQFLDCFSLPEISSILSRTKAIMGPESRLYIMELLWNRQKFEPAAFCMTMTSIYFTAMANGNSKMYYSEDLVNVIKECGLEVEKIIDGIGQGHSILVCKVAQN